MKCRTNILVLTLTIALVQGQSIGNLPLSTDSFGQLKRMLTPVLVQGQSIGNLPLSTDSFRPLKRMLTPVPPGRVAKLSDVMLRHYGNDTKPTSSHTLGTAKEILSDKFFNLKNPTVVYAHGYVELVTDESVQTVIAAYIDSSGYNVLVLDWSNMAYGNYINVALDLKVIGEELAKALVELVNGGLSLDGLHLVGHSLGTHLMGFAAREMNKLGKRVPRLTGLDPALPGFYPPIIFAAPMSAGDADFVDAIHTDAGGIGTAQSTAQADFWPNGGRGKQPGCPAPTLPLTTEDLCSHWRSWWVWAESVRGGKFLARFCNSEDDFSRGKCKSNPLVDMGVRASPDLKGNYYLRTATSSPFALGVPGAE